MKTERDHISSDKDFGELDLPLLAWKCFTGGVLAVGVCDAVVIFPILSIIDLELKWRFIFSGIANVGVAFILLFLESVYWWRVTRKTGVIIAKSLIISPLLCVLTLVSGIFIGAIITNVITGLI